MKPLINNHHVLRSPWTKTSMREQLLGKAVSVIIKLNKLKVASYR